MMFHPDLKAVEKDEADKTDTAALRIPYRNVSISRRSLLLAADCVNSR